MKPILPTILLSYVMLLPSCSPAPAPEPPEELPLQPTHTLGADSYLLSCLDFSPDSKLLGGSSFGSGKDAIVWELATGKEKARWAHPDQVYAIRFHPRDGTVITGCSDGHVRVWELGKQEPKAVFPRPFDDRGISRLAISPTGTRLVGAISSYTGPVLWDAKTGKSKLLPPSSRNKHDYIDCIAFSPDGSRCVVSRPYGTDVWDMEKENVVGPLTYAEHKKSIDPVCFSPNGKLIAGGFEREVGLWDAEKLTELAVLDKMSSNVEGLQFTPDGKYLIGCAGPGIDSGAGFDKPGEVVVWDVAGKKKVGSFAPHRNGCVALAISPDGKWLATGAWIGGVRLWDLPALLEKLAK